MGILFNPFGLLTPKDFYIICLSNRSTKRTLGWFKQQRIVRSKTEIYLLITFNRNQCD
jgi:hypothetical protein